VPEVESYYPDTVKGWLSRHGGLTVDTKTIESGPELFPDAHRGLGRRQVVGRPGRCRIIKIESAHGLVASPFKSAYVAAKHSLVDLTKVTALETAEQ
jgi:NAD(P)-dependent dehydrogenase (short-subunit alcohol dehydrogenase family)